MTAVRAHKKLPQTLSHSHFLMQLKPGATRRQQTGSGDGVFYSYSYLYKLFFYWGVLTFRLHDLATGGPKSTPSSVAVALLARFGYVCGFLGGAAMKRIDEQMSQAIFSHLSPVIKVIFAWEVVSVTLTYIECCIMMDLHRRRHIQLLCSMQQLDFDISEQFPYVRWNYNKSQRKWAYGTGGVSICYLTVSLIFIFATARCSCGYLSSLLIGVAYSVLTATVGTSGFMHISIMDYLRIRFRLIVKLLQQQYDQSEKSQNAEQLHLRIHKLFEYSKRCSQLLAEMNVVFGFVIAASTFYDFTILTCFVYAICQKTIESDSSVMEYIFISLLIAVHCYKLVIVSVYGYLLQREKRNCQHKLSQYEEHFADQDSVRCLVQSFEHWRLHNKDCAMIGFALPCNTFAIYVVINGVANYVIILVQLLFQHKQLKLQRHGLARMWN